MFDLRPPEREALPLDLPPRAELPAFLVRPLAERRVELPDAERRRDPRPERAVRVEARPRVERRVELAVRPSERTVSVGVQPISASASFMAARPRSTCSAMPTVMRT